MSDRYLNWGGIKGKLSVKFFIYDFVLLRICQFIEMFEMQFISNSSLSLNCQDCYRHVTLNFLL